MVHHSNGEFKKSLVSLMSLKNSIICEIRTSLDQKNFKKLRAARRGLITWI